jgi:hypothetical protein
MAMMSAIVFARWYADLFAWIGLDAVADALRVVGSIAWPWHVVIGTTLTVTVGSLLSLTHPPPPDPAHGRDARRAEGTVPR